MNLRIGLDIDDTICDFMNEYIKIYGQPKNDSEITRNVTQELSKNKNFWLHLPIINRPDFEPVLYCTKRVNPKCWTKQYIRENGLPDKAVYQIYCQTANKALRVKGRVDVFIDDSVTNFMDLNKAGVPCLLMDQPYNRWWKTVGRVFSLEYMEIYKCYKELMKSICSLH